MDAEVRALCTHAVFHATTTRQQLAMLNQLVSVATSRRAAKQAGGGSTHGTIEPLNVAAVRTSTLLTVLQVFAGVRVGALPLHQGQALSSVGTSSPAFPPPSRRAAAATACSAATTSDSEWPIPSTSAPCPLLPRILSPHVQGTALTKLGPLIAARADVPCHRLLVVLQQCIELQGDRSLRVAAWRALAAVARQRLLRAGKSSCKNRETGIDADSCGNSSVGTGNAFVFRALEQMQATGFKQLRQCEHNLQQGGAADAEVVAIVRALRMLESCLCQAEADAVAATAPALRITHSQGAPRRPSCLLASAAPSIRSLAEAGRVFAVRATASAASSFGRTNICAEDHRESVSDGSSQASRSSNGGLSAACLWATVQVRGRGRLRAQGRQSNYSLDQHCLENLFGDLLEDMPSLHARCAALRTLASLAQQCRLALTVGHSNAEGEAAQFHSVVCERLFGLLRQSSQASLDRKLREQILLGLGTTLPQSRCQQQHTRSENIDRKKRKSRAGAAAASVVVCDAHEIHAVADCCCQPLSLSTRALASNLLVRMLPSCHPKVAESISVRLAQAVEAATHAVHAPPHLPAGSRELEDFYAQHPSINPLLKAIAKVGQLFWFRFPPNCLLLRVRAFPTHACHVIVGDALATGCVQGMDSVVGTTTGGGGSVAAVAAFAEGSGSAQSNRDAPGGRGGAFAGVVRPSVSRIEFADGWRASAESGHVFPTPRSRREENSSEFARDQFTSLSPFAATTSPTKQTALMEIALVAGGVDDGAQQKVQASPSSFGSRRTTLLRRFRRVCASACADARRLLGEARKAARNSKAPQDRRNMAPRRMPQEVEQDGSGKRCHSVASADGAFDRQLAQKLTFLRSLCSGYPSHYLLMFQLLEIVGMLVANVIAGRLTPKQQLGTVEKAVVERFNRTWQALDVSQTTLAVNVEQHWLESLEQAISAMQHMLSPLDERLCRKGFDFQLRCCQVLPGFSARLVASPFSTVGAGLQGVQYGGSESSSAFLVAVHAVLDDCDICSMRDRLLLRAELCSEGCAPTCVVETVSTPFIECGQHSAQLWFRLDCLPGVVLRVNRTRQSVTLDAQIRIPERCVQEWVSRDHARRLSPPQSQVFEQPTYQQPPPQRPLHQTAPVTAATMAVTPDGARVRITPSAKLPGGSSSSGMGGAQPPIPPEKRVRLDDPSGHMHSKRAFSTPRVAVRIRVCVVAKVGFGATTSGEPSVVTVPGMYGSAVLL
eukprot:INCI1809.1.p1 GENE.INCI1809.1~~INCI1809.1.p1  ORF type:complete len:1232 (-),score=178.90 INCI1809.1:178-3873(-)